MIDRSVLAGVSAFANLPDDQLEWFLSHAEEVHLEAGEPFARIGDPPAWLFVMLEGQFQWRGEFGGETVVLPSPAGEVTGVYPFSRMKAFTVAGIALSRAKLLRFPASLFPELIPKMPEFTARLVAMMSDRIREGTRIEQQKDRLFSLGRLSAGLAHELNNPAAAAARAASQLQEHLDRLKFASFELGRCALSEEQRLDLVHFEKQLEPSCDPDPLALGDLEDQIASVLQLVGEHETWQSSSALARCQVQPEALRSMLLRLDPAAVHVAVTRLAATAELAVLSRAIVSSTTRISELVGAVKEYTYRDQASVQDVDIVRSLESTLAIFDHKVREGITVVRDYQPLPLLVNSFGSQLNQVWTNLIVNAIEAMAGKGELRLRTFVQGEMVIVEIGDNGPGIPAEIRSHIFEPFFTTKAIGEGTGLGLDTALRIVRNHQGEIHVESCPGDTRFQVWLPLVAEGEGLS
ncbi:MAG: hypothetical protein JF584_11385 [Acidobacteria bacterium]|nr:hypothetical protein [Acidobacteriota bacterium]